MTTTSCNLANEFNPQEYFKDKKVLIIGNSQYPKESNYSKYDSIVRLNLGVQEQPCDVWIDNLVYQGHSLLPYLPNVDKIMRMNCEKNGRRLKRIPKELEKKPIWYWNVNEYNLMCNQFVYQRPSTGFIATYYFLNYIRCSLTITGFDFFKSRNRWTMEIHPTTRTYAYPSHDFEKEKRIISEWVKEGKLNAII